MTDASAGSVAIPAKPKTKRPFRWSDVGDHVVLILGSLFMLVPLLVLSQMSSVPDVEVIKTGPSFQIGDQLDDNFEKAMFKASGFSGLNTGTSMLINSFILGIGFALGKILIGMMAAYAIVYFLSLIHI